MLGIGKEKKSIFNENIADLIPVVCHYDSKTLLTKNGDLLQIISVEGFVKNGEEVTGLDLREEVRKTLKEYVTDPEIAIYIHVCRDYKDIMPKKYDEKENAIVQGIENKWCEKNNWDKQLVNTIYITLLKKGPRIKFFNIADFISSIIPFALKKKYSKYFTKAITELDKVSHNIAESLGIFSTKILTVFEKNQELYSEPLSFYHYLMCFVKSDIKIEKIDFSSLLSDIKLESDFNVTTIYYENTTKFVALYSIEVPFETKLNVLESLLNIPSKFIITELITFVSSEKALHSVKKYKSILDSIKNTEISDVIALNEFIKSDTKQKNDFCSSQITFAIYADNYQDLEDISIDFAKKLNVSGIKAVREDFNMQAALLNSLPGNTFFSNRSNMLPTLFTSSLCNIHSKKIGNYNGSKWGDPVTILKTIYGKYYHFNFHDKENGNTIIVGPKYSGKSTITNFLLAQSLKFDIKLLYLDLEGRAKDFIKGIGGSVLELSEEKESEIQFDIMNLEGEYFADFLLKICSLDDPFRYKNAKYIKKFRTLPSLLKDVDNTEDKIKIIDKFIDEFNDLTIKTNYKNFFHSKFYSNFFEKDNVKILNDTQYLNVDFSKIYNNPKLFKPFFSLVVNNIVNSLNGDKTIIVINNAQSFFDGYGFNGKISKILKDIGKKNAILILIQENFEEEELPDTFENEVANFATRLFLSDRMIDKKYKYLYNLSDQEFNYIKSYDSKKRRFLLKYREDSVFAEVNLDGFGDILKLLG